MMSYYLAIDIGASSGRHILLHKGSGKVIAEEIYRFNNQMVNNDNSLCWDIDNLLYEVIKGIKKCKEINKIPCSVSIDTWAVDYVLLDKDDNILGKTYAYRDTRIHGADKIVEAIISDSELYQRTGIQKQLFNTIYQLTALKRDEPEILETAHTFLMIPDYLHYRLTGIKTNEYTNATTTGLVNCHTKDWDYKLIKNLGLSRHIFQKLINPLDTVGEFTDEIKKEIGFSSKIVMCATHDTGSAVVAIPTIVENSLFLSSGTWSLLGVETRVPITSKESQTANYTNEGGFDDSYRFLKNIMGLWMIQCIYHEFKEKYSYSEISKMAAGENIATIVDCNDERFFAPKSMTDEIKLLAKETNQKIPESIGEIVAVVYNSLGVCYRKAIDEIEKLTGRSYNLIHIIGGGANAEYLNKVTARVTGRKVIAGPTEATAIGNGLCQMLASGEFSSIKKARECVKRSFDLKEYGGAE